MWTKIFSFAFISLVLLTNPALAGDQQPSSFTQSGVPDSLPLINEKSSPYTLVTPDDFQSRVYKKVADLDVDIGLDIFNFALGDAGNLAAHYRYAIDRGFQKDLFNRIDAWKLNVGLRVGDIISSAVNEDLPIFLNIDRDAEIIFLRQFYDKHEASRSAPRTPADLPISAERALAHMGVGDVVAIPVKLNLAVGARFGTDLGYLNAAASKGYVLSGRFMLQVLRTGEHGLRLRIFADSSKGSEGDLYARLGFTLFSIEAANHALDRLVHLDIVDFKKVDREGKLLLFDYTFDTDSDEARTAYDSVMRSTLKFKDATLAKDYVQGKDPREAYLSDLRLAEDLSFDDRDSENPRVRRLALVENDYTRDISSRRFDLILASWRQEKNYSENFVTVTDRFDNVKSYFVPTFVRWNRNDLGLVGSGFKSEVRRSTFAVLEDLGKAEHFASLGQIYDENESLFSDDEQNKVRNILYGALPADFYQSIDWKDWKWSDYDHDLQDHRAARVYFKLLIDSRAVTSLSRYTWEQIYARIRWVLLLNRPDDSGNDSLAREVADHIDTILHDESLSDRERVASLMDLRKKELFADLGAGFLVGLLTADELQKYAYLDFQMFASDAAEIKVQVGNPAYASTFRLVQDIDDTTSDQTTDPRGIGTNPQHR